MPLPGKSGMSTTELGWALEPACDAASPQGAGMTGHPAYFTFIIWVILLTFRLSCLPDKVANGRCIGKKREVLE